MTNLTLSSSDPTSLTVDALVVGVASGARGPVVVAPDPAALDRAVPGGLRAALTALGARGTAGEVTRMATLGALAAPTLLAVGLGEQPPRGASYDPETLRRAAGTATRTLAGVKKVGLALDEVAADDGRLRAICEGALLGAYAFDRYRTASREGRPAPVERVTVVAGGARTAAAKQAVRRAEHVTRAVTLARDLVNTPPDDLHPAELADAAVATGRERDLAVEVLDEKALHAAGFGGILGVGAGSTNPPRLVRVAHTPADARATIHLVGKGITFDSGGLSLKPGPAMEWMKSDMGGAAAVLAAVSAVADLGLPVAVVGWLPTAENMPSGSAIRPSDVLTMYGGRTVEVLNTDAEGRLVLADAIVRAGEESPDVLVDVATLTGAQLVALGSRTMGVMGSDDEVRTRVVDAAGHAGEAAWPMPLPADLRSSLDSDIADVKNIGDRNGGMLVAGLFLRDFVAEGLPWAHLDIAGPAFNQGDAYGYTPKGGTGAAVRTLVRFCEDMAERPDGAG